MPQYASATSTSTTVDVGKRDCRFYKDSAGTTEGVNLSGATYNAGDTPYPSIESGDDITISGYLLDYETKQALSGKTVELKLIDMATGTTVAGPIYVTTQTDGSFSGTLTCPSVTSPTDHYAGGVFAGDNTYNQTTVNMPFTVDYRTPNLTLSMPTTGTAGATVTWSGSLTDPEVTTYGISGKNIYLDESTDGTTWTEGVAGPVTTDANGAYSGSYTLPTASGTYYYRSRFPGGSPGVTHPAAVSPTIKVRVMTLEELQKEQMIKFAVIGAVAIGVGGLAYYYYKKKH